MLLQGVKVTKTDPNTLGLRLKLFIKVNFFNVDAKRLAAGYRRGKAVRPSPLALASPFGRRGDAKGDSAAVASLRASAVKRLVRAASPLGEATAAPRTQRKGKNA